MKCNSDIRTAIKIAGLYMWQVGERAGMSDSNFSRMLRHELPIEKKQHILEIIKEMKKEVKLII